VSRPHPRPFERGSASVLLIGVFVVGVVLLVGSARLGAALFGRARAQNAADAAALAAADALALAGTPARAEFDAAETAAANGARLVACRCQLPRVTVSVEYEVGVLGRVARARASAEIDGVVVPPP
jgi:secretion/DNA translocation related TadE-like protein